MKHFMFIFIFDDLLLLSCNVWAFWHKYVADTIVRQTAQTEQTLLRGPGDDGVDLAGGVATGEGQVQLLVVVTMA